MTLDSVDNGSSTPYHYSVSIHNTGTTNVSTYWFGWLPGYDFMPTLPVNVNSPSGWTGSGLNDSFYGNYSLEWTTSTNPIGPGQTLGGFSFDSADSPAQLTAPSQYFGSFYPNNTSYVYIGASETDPGSVFQTTVSTPEPASLLLLVPAGLLLRRRGRCARGEPRAAACGY
jgi:hypothetical protein